MRLTCRAARKKRWEKQRNEQDERKDKVFKKKGHQEQSDFNERVVECVENTAEAITRQPADDSTLDKAKMALGEGLELLASRQKLIKIVDRSEFGLGVVAGYEADDLASDSDNEKKLEKVERNVERKMMKRRKAGADRDTPAK